MNNKKRYRSAVAVLLVLSLVWIIAICAMMWGRSVAAFSFIKLTIFIALIVVEVVTVTAEFICAAKLGRLNNEQDAEEKALPKAEDRSSGERRHQRRGSWLTVAGIAASCVLAISGTLLGRLIPVKLTDIALIAAIVFDAVPAGILAFSVVSAKKYEKELKATDIAEWQSYMLTRRTQAEETADEKLDELLMRVHRNDVCAVTVGVMGILAALLAGLSLSTGTTVLYLIAALWTVCALSRVRFAPDEDIFNDDEFNAYEEDYPELYALVRQAQSVVGAEGEPIISLRTDCNAGICRVGDVCSVQLGVILLGILNEAELYTVLLHEFEHLVSSSDEDDDIRNFSAWLVNGGNRSAVSHFADLLFMYNDAIFTFEYATYTFACALINESRADMAMVRHAGAELAAPVIKKLKYHDMFEWETALCDCDVYYKSEEPDKYYIERQLNKFVNAMSERYEVWDELMEREIPARNATHPTAKQRIEAMYLYAEELAAAPEKIPEQTEEFTEEYAEEAAEEYAEYVKPEPEELYFDVSNPAETYNYRADCDRALDFVQESLYEFVSENYEATRQEHYVKPCELIEKWEQEGRPLIAMEYADLVAALLDVGRASDAVELCTRAIDELPEPATYYARFIKASALLRACDERGLELMYKAIEGNSNYIDEGLELIGAFCCYTGNEGELGIYREKAIELVRAQQEKYLELSTLSRHDELSYEELPEEELDEILDYILIEDEYEAIKRIYLIRKTINEDFFTSVFIMEFAEGTDADVKQYLLHRMFCCLDVRERQYSLFDYDEVSGIGPEKIEGSLVFERPDPEQTEEVPEEALEEMPEEVIEDLPEEYGATIPEFEFTYTMDYLPPEQNNEE